MGVYLSTPITEKFSSDNKCKNFTYGASSMQGWRTSQEDAHNCVPDFDEERKASLFAVYDGHGGAEVAQYCAAKLPGFIKSLPSYKNGSLESALEEAFLEFDAELIRDEVVKELKVLAQLDDDEKDDEAQTAGMGKSEADVLRAEANMPLEELLAKYEGFTGIPPEVRSLRKKKDVKSPMIRNSKSRVPSDGSGDTDSDKCDNDSDIKMNSDETGAVATQLEDKLANGHAENENNLNMEKEQSQRQAESSVTNVQSIKETRECDSCTSIGEEGAMGLKSKVAGSSEASASKDTCDSDKPNSSLQSSSISSSEEPSSSDQGLPASRSVNTKTVNSTTEEEPGSSSSAGPASSGSSGSEQCPTGSTAAGSSYQEPASSSSSQAGSTSKKSKDEDEDNEDDDDEGEEEDMYKGIDEEGDSSEDEDVEFDSEDDDDEEEESEEEEEEEETEDSMIEETNGNEEPGSDSGCTAVVALLKDKDIYVANAGDSRCVLCRKGNAIDLSFDHKPEDEPEKKRIEAAGGKVTPDGRVNGGLNLSRAIGDHFYKRNKTMSPKEQMITALPDIQTTTLEDGDEFLVLACDGIWNYMSSQEVVDFIRERLKEPEKRERPSLICEQIFDYCLAPNTMGDGTGCDNMTCIIITFEHLWNNNLNKRTASELETNHEAQTEQPPEKRVKLDTETEDIKLEAESEDSNSKSEQESS